MAYTYKRRERLSEAADRPIDYQIVTKLIAIYQYYFEYLHLQLELIQTEQKIALMKTNFELFVKQRFEVQPQVMNPCTLESNEKNTCLRILKDKLAYTKDILHILQNPAEVFNPYRTILNQYIVMHDSSIGQEIESYSHGLGINVYSEAERLVQQLFSPIYRYCDNSLFGLPCPILSEDKGDELRPKL